MPNTQTLDAFLAGSQVRGAPVIPIGLTRSSLATLDLSPANPELDAVDLADPKAFSRYVQEVLERSSAEVGIGRYAEPRVIYRHSSLFDGASEARTIHLGIDLFAPAGTPVHAPLPGTVHSFAVNEAIGDYGPTIILEHELGGRVFFTLYGHLSLDSLERLQEGRVFSGSAEIARIGGPAENGRWAPHLHFQIIADMGGHRGDFPGVTGPTELDHYLQLCPNPNLILGLPVPVVYEPGARRQT